MLLSLFSCETNLTQAISMRKSRAKGERRALVGYDLAKVARGEGGAQVTLCGNGAKFVSGVCNAAPVRSGEKVDAEKYWRLLHTVIHIPGF